MRPSQRAPAQLTDLRLAGEQTVEGTPAVGYDLFVHEESSVHGPVRLLVAKDSGLPLRIEMNDPQARGGLRMDYTDFNKPVEIQVPSCLSGS